MSDRDGARDEARDEVRLQERAQTVPGGATPQRTLSAKLMKEDPRSGSGLGSGAWGQVPGARCWLDTGGASGIIGQVGSWSTTAFVCVSASVALTTTVPRTVPQPWGRGLHWSGSIGSHRTDARGWNRALEPAIDGGVLVEVGAEVNGSRRSHDRTGQRVG